MNAEFKSRFPWIWKTFLSADSVYDEDQNGLRCLAELLNCLNGGASLPNHWIQLKKGIMVMLLRNLCPEEGCVNFTSYILQHMSSNLRYLKFAVGSHAGSRLTLPRVPCGPGDDKVSSTRLKKNAVPCPSVLRDDNQHGTGPVVWKQTWAWPICWLRCTRPAICWRVSSNRPEKPDRVYDPRGL